MSVAATRVEYHALAPIALNSALVAFYRAENCVLGHPNTPRYLQMLHLSISSVPHWENESPWFGWAPFFRPIRLPQTPHHQASANQPNTIDWPTSESSHQARSAPQANDLQWLPHIDVQIRQFATPMVRSARALVQKIALAKQSRSLSRRPQPIRRPGPEVDHREFLRLEKHGLWQALITTAVAPALEAQHGITQAKIEGECNCVKTRNLDWKGR